MADEANTFADARNALRMRDAMQRLMIKMLDQERPPYQYGIVEAINTDGFTCQVILNGDTAAIQVAYGAMRPVAAGQVVRVSGNRGDRFISDVMGGAAPSDYPTGSMSAPTGFTMGGSYRGVFARWNPVDGAYQYEIQFAADAGMTTSLRTYKTVSTGFSEEPLTSGQTVWSRVRALSSPASGTTAGPWTSPTISATAVAMTPTDLTDGAAPSSSPDAVVTGSLGFLLVEWLPVSNNDPVIYEVHVSTTNGFTPNGALTKIGETGGTFYTIKRTADGVVLAYDTTYFVRLIAKDRDGAAAVGGQGFASLQRFGTMDVSQIDYSKLGDGAPPGSSPTPTVTNGIGYLYATWTLTGDNDYTVYEVHISTVSGFTPSGATYVGGTPSDFFFIRKTGAGAQLAYGTTYYVKLIAKDVDGQAAASAEASGTPLQVTTTDIGPNQITTPLIVAGAVTAASAIIADAAIGTAKIQDANITTAKIAGAAITSAQIANLAVITAAIDNLAVVTAKIDALAVTNAKIFSMDVQKLIAGTITAKVIVIGSGGIFQIGGDPGVTTGGLFINDQGIRVYVAGNATPKGIFDVSGAITLTGATIQSAASGARVVLDSNDIKVVNSSGVTIFQAGNTNAYVTIPGGASGGLSSGFRLSGTAKYLTFAQGSPGLDPELMFYLDDDDPAIVWGSPTFDDKLEFNTGDRQFHATQPFKITTALVSGSPDSNRSHLRGEWGSDSGAGLRGRNGHTISMDWTGSALVFYIDNAGGGGNITLNDATTLTTNGTKTFVINHPTDPTRYLLHACPEGETVDVFYRGQATIGPNGTALVKLPHYFEALTHESKRTVTLTPMGAPKPLGASYPTNGELIVEGAPGQAFFWRVDAVRITPEPFRPEPLKALTRVFGDGPYKYIR